MSGLASCFPGWCPLFDACICSCRLLFPVLDDAPADPCAAVLPPAAPPAATVCPAPAATSTPSMLIGKGTGADAAALARRTMLCAMAAAGMVVRCARAAAVDTLSTDPSRLAASRVGLTDTGVCDTSRQDDVLASYAARQRLHVGDEPPQAGRVLKPGAVAHLEHHAPGQRGRQRVGPELEGQLGGEGQCDDVDV
eukprot:CAMPEP_0202887284 /NCGR_PEP_ID=MMETSP1391-20130828/42604_1 /ASSEMBLY_ACC=CAM_ASM_000867 /TAXON_ID=1034604 /ORGANISM="Chlamydomonas leiostraca, Strain SAG 11-49" /LENGTH=194 /DNA_ID=CAMNT_0049570569 /DNA_START=247 /DNA_END=830 /DNA_ORIENTATION=+